MRFTDAFKRPGREIPARLDALEAYHREFTNSHALPFGRVQEGRNGGDILSSNAAAGTHEEPRTLFMLGSNDYLGLSKHPRIRATVDEHLQRYGSGSSGSPLLSGAYRTTRNLERRLADLHQMEDALLFCSTYNANLGAIAGLLTRQDTCVIDRSAHTSIQDGARLAGCQVKRFKHNDPKSLEKILDSIDPKKALVFVDSLYSMEGHFCDLAGISEVVRESGALLAVDEAHAVGMVGKNGEGLVRSLGLSAQVDILTGSLGKALASSGGYICASRKICKYLRFVATPYIFSSSLSPVNAAIALESIAIMEQEDPVARVQGNIVLAHALLQERGFEVPQARTGIIPIAIGDEKKTLEVANDLEAKGIFVNPVIFPAVGKGRGILRLSMSAAHSEDQLRWALLEVVASVETVRKK